MTEHSSASPALLPSGLFDLTGEAAEAESRLVAAMLAHFRACGYALAQPPLMEFTDSLLLADHDGTLAQRSLRVMDPVSQQLMAIRADMTMQLARIAGTLLRDAPRPLRLCYAGQTLRSLPDTMRSSRQFRQIGIELFGAEPLSADVEVMQTAVAALRQSGAGPLSIDLSAPALLDMLCADTPPEERDTLIQAIRSKQHHAIDATRHPLLHALAAIAAPADDALKQLAKLELPERVRQITARLAQTCRLLNERLDSAASITLDPLEMRGFGYHTWLSFSIYSTTHRTELGRGGRYRTPYGETATGFTLYAEDMLALLAPGETMPLVMLPAHCPEEIAASWRARGYRSVYALGDDPRAEAAAQGCRHLLNDDLTTVEALQ